MRVHTENSIYKLNLEDKTWTRTQKSDASGVLRTETGTYIHIDGPALGHSMLLECPPINPPMRRLIITSPVVKIEEGI